MPLKPTEFQDHPIRAFARDDELWFLASDVCKAVGVGKVSHMLSRLDDDEKGAVLSDTPGGPQKVTIVSETGMYQLAMSSRKPQAKPFQKWAANLVKRFRKGDLGLATEIVERNDGSDPAGLERLAERAKSKAGARVLANEAAARGMKRKFDFAAMHDANNVFITGNTACELKSLRQVETTRDSFEAGELSLLNVTQHAQVKLLHDKNAQSAGEILGSNEEVRDDLREFRDKYFGKKYRPAVKDGQTPVITVEA